MLKPSEFESHVGEVELGPPPAPGMVPGYVILYPETQGQNEQQPVSEFVAWFPIPPTSKMPRFYSAGWHELDIATVRYAMFRIKQGEGTTTALLPIVHVYPADQSP